MAESKEGKPFVSPNEGVPHSKYFNRDQRSSTGSLFVFGGVEFTKDEVTILFREKPKEQVRTGRLQKMLDQHFSSDK
jgi:hypothetical protein